MNFEANDTEEKGFRKNIGEQDVHRLGRGFRQNTIYTIMREHALWSTGTTIQTHTHHTHTCGWERGHIRVYIHMHEMNEAM